MLLRGPSNKFDIEVINHLQLRKSDELIPLLPELLEWIQDMNWPVALPIVHLLSKQKTENLIPDFISILDSQNSIWKYNVLLFIERYFSSNYVKILQ